MNVLLCFICRECEVIAQADEDDTLYRIATPSVTKGGKGKDFILLASRRKPCDSRCCEMTWLASFYVSPRCSFLLFNNAPLIAASCMHFPPLSPSGIHT